MSAPSRNGWGLAMAATIAVAAALRFYGLGSSLWYDEIVTLVESARRPVLEILTYFPDVNVHPLYSLLAHVSLETFGESNWALRLPACVFGVGVGMDDLRARYSIGQPGRGLGRRRDSDGVVSARLVLPECAWVHDDGVLRPAVDVFPAAGRRVQARGRLRVLCAGLRGGDLHASHHGVCHRWPRRGHRRRQARWLAGYPGAAIQAVADGLGGGRRPFPWSLRALRIPGPRAFRAQGTGAGRAIRDRTMGSDRRC